MRSHLSLQRSFSALGLLSGLLGMACASAPAAPFDSLKSANATAYRLQNFEPPAAAAVPGAAAPGAAPAIPGVPPEIMTWIQTGAQGLSQLIPPGQLAPHRTRIPVVVGEKQELTGRTGQQGIPQEPFYANDFV